MSPKHLCIQELSQAQEVQLFYAIKGMTYQQETELLPGQWWQALTCLPILPQILRSPPAAHIPLTVIDLFGKPQTGHSAGEVQ